jgi:hypothetical protein
MGLSGYTGVLALPNRKAGLVLSKMKAKGGHEKRILKDFIASIEYSIFESSGRPWPNLS